MSVSEPSAGESWSGKEIFTTGEAARVCNVSQQTIIRCFDRGRLKGFRVPGSKFRRIPREALIEFMRANRIPLDRLENGTKRVLLIDDDPQSAALAEALEKTGRIEVRRALTAYEAGMLTAEFRPQLVVFDFKMPDIRGESVCRTLRDRTGEASTRIVCLSGAVSQSEVDQILAAGAEEHFRKPFNVDRVAARIEDLLGLS